jgi:hypothetical protein
MLEAGMLDLLRGLIKSTGEIAAAVALVLLAFGVGVVVLVIMFVLEDPIG